MEMIRGRTLSEVRRYDFWKLLIAALLFINALFICGKPAVDPADPVSATPQSTAAPVAAAPAAPGTPAAPAASAPTAPAVSAPAAAAASAPAAPAVSAPAVPAVATPPTKPLAAKIYFANDAIALPADAGKLLTEVIAWAKAAPGNKLALSGFHSAAGALDRNHELAKGRAMAVAAVLKSAGVPEGQIEFRKPVQELGGVSPSEARRVEVMPAN